MELTDLPENAVALRAPAVPEPPPIRLTLADLAAFTAALRSRCRLMGGALSGQTWTVIAAEDDAALAQIEATLTRMAPYTDGIRRLIARGDQDQ